MPKVFISYSRTDSAFADRLIKNLSERGVESWVDRENIEGGQMWRSAISQAIAGCDVFLVVLSPNCVQSKNVVKELSLAESHDRPILPILFETCKIPPEMDYQLAGLQWVEFAGNQYEQSFDRLVKALSVRHGMAVSDQPVKAAEPPRPAAPPPQNPPQQTIPQPQNPTAPYPPPAPLYQIVCGRWDIQINAPYVGQIGRLGLDVYPNGAFGGQLMTPMGNSNVNGRWQITQVGQLMLQGQQTMGWNTGPYLAIVTFNQVAPGLLSGITAGGEQVVWRRLA